MDLLERYLQAVRKYLPWTLSRSRQDDIMAELRSDLESQLEEREADIGRSLTEGEMIDWLKHLGAPVKVAGRYQPVQYLIGPTLFPMYLYVLRLAAIWTVIVYAVIAVITVWTAAPHVPSVSDWIFRLPGTVLNTAFWVTLVFVAIEYFLAHHPQMLPPIEGVSKEWSPSTLPPLEPVETKKPKGFAQAVAEVIFGYLFFCWLALILKYPFLWLGPGVYYLRTSPIAPAHIWWTFYWVVLVINFSQNVWNTIDLLSGRWRREQRLKPIFFKVFGLIPMATLIAAPGQIYAVLRNPAVDAAKYGSVADTINTNVWRAVVVVFAILAIQILWEIYQWFKESRRSAAL
jgi:hypothetical protein